MSDGFRYLATREKLRTFLRSREWETLLATLDGDVRRALEDVISKGMAR